MSNGFLQTGLMNLSMAAVNRTSLIRPVLLEAESYPYELSEPRPAALVHHLCKRRLEPR